MSQSITTSARLGLTVEESDPIHLHDRRPVPGAPNVVAIVLDDTGFAQLGAFGSDIKTPHMDQLGAEGLMYNRFHVTSLCSPTRACFLTGRNHHAVGMGFLADIPLAFPGYTSRIPRSAATMARTLRDVGYNTCAIGKWHLVPRFQRSAAGPFDYWPLGLGFERYYGFLQGDTNHWTPNLVCDNHYIDPPGRPEGGYHLSEDLADTAIRFVSDQTHAAPGKPFFLYFALGAMHAPHHVAPEWADPYRGDFDHGWEAWREETFARQLASGIVPEGTVLPPRPPWVQAWNDLGADERRMHARMQEVFAGFLTHTDAQIGRVLSHLESLGLLDNTLVLLFSDNGASAEGGQLGSVNEHRFTARIPDSLSDNLAALDDWGGPNTYNHYSWGWAWAGNTPHRLWKRYTWLGGVRTPLMVRWPAGMNTRGEVRSQFAHVIDLLPTVLDACGVEAPRQVDGVDQQPIDGASLRPTFDDAGAPDPRETQYFEMYGSRSVVHKGWKATTDHVAWGILDEERFMEGSRTFEDDTWALFNLRQDFSESTDLAGELPDKVEELREVWFAEAGRNQVLPIGDALANRFKALIGPQWMAPAVQRYRPGASPICDESVPILIGGFTAAAVVDVPEGARDGVLFALGDWNGGYALFVSDSRLSFTLSVAGLVTEVVAEEPVPSGRHNLSVQYDKSPDGDTFTLLHDNRAVGTTSLVHGFGLTMQHGGVGMRLGYDAGLPVSRRYAPPARWPGRLEEVVFYTGGAEPAVEEEIRAALHSD